MLDFVKVLIVLRIFCMCSIMKGNIQHTVIIISMVKKKEKKHVLIGVNVIRREIIQRCHFKGL